ncbi:NUDIX hydrolase [Nonomuraea sp. NPDC050451]|uniref:NUDIX hydrolase n=1 Tax=Nonomuraea sp. NPDC050451 TaxID=3364364 RepID=UPI0037B61348
MAVQSGRELRHRSRASGRWRVHRTLRPASHRIPTLTPARPTRPAVFHRRIPGRCHASPGRPTAGGPAWAFRSKIIWRAPSEPTRRSSNSNPTPPWLCTKFHTLGSKPSAKQDLRNLLASPGGGVEDSDASLEAALLREVREELAGKHASTP